MPPAFALYLDADRRVPTPYHDGNDYLEKARDRIERTFALIRPHVAGAVVLDVGASPFYLLFRAKAAGAARVHGTFFSHDSHPLKDVALVHSAAGPIEISRADAETEKLPFADDSVDILTACEILEHFDLFPARFAAEARRVLKPGGRLVITVPNVASIANIIKLLFQKNIYMRWRSDPTGRHKHEFTAVQLRAFADYLGMEVERAGFMPSPTSDKFALRPVYRLLARLPVLRRYSPVLYLVARQPDPKPARDLKTPPPALYDAAESVEI